MLCVLAAMPARADVTQEPIQDFFGEVDGTPSNLVINKDQGKSATNAVSIIYDNTLSAANFGFSSTDLLAVFGDELFTTGLGILSTHQLSLFNAGSGSVPIRVEKACGVSSDVIASRIGFHRCPYSHDLEVA